MSADGADLTDDGDPAPPGVGSTPTAGGDVPTGSRPPPAGQPGVSRAAGESAATEGDALFCRIAVRSGLIDPSQAEEILAAVRGQGAAAAAELCVARGWLTLAQTRALRASVEAATGASPEALGDGAREFGRLVEMKRLAEDGRVDACRTIQQELAGTPYARLGELLLQKAQRRGGAPAAPRGMANRQQAFDTYVRLKQAVQRGEVDEAARLAALLRDDPQFGRVSLVQLERARTRRAIVERTRRDVPPDAPRQAGVAPCPTCGASTRHADACPRARGGEGRGSHDNP